MFSTSEPASPYFVLTIKIQRDTSVLTSSSASSSGALQYVQFSLEHLRGESLQMDLAFQILNERGISVKRFVVVAAVEF